MRVCMRGEVKLFFKGERLWILYVEEVVFPLVSKRRTFFWFLRERKRKRKRESNGNRITQSMSVLVVV